MALMHEALKPLIGSEVKADAATLLAGTHGADLHDLLIERGVLLFRDVHLGEAELNAFAKTLGPLDDQDEQAGNFKVTMDEKVNPLALILYGTRA